MVGRIVSDPRRREPVRTGPAAPSALVGSQTLQVGGGTHGTGNNTESPLEFLNFSVSARNDGPDATDLADDLSVLL